MIIRKMRFSLSLIAVFIVLCSGFYMLHGLLQPNIKATWLWDSKRINDERESIMSFAGQQDINLIYLHIDQKQNINDYREFIKSAGLSGIQVHALGGDPSWATEENRVAISEFIRWVDRYNRNSSTEERFTGIHVDIEPYNQAAWESDQRQAIIDDWLASLDYFTDLTKDMHQIQTGADLPYWLDEIPISQEQGASSMSEWMLERLDHVTLMAYRNQADTDGGIVHLVQEEVKIANALKKKIIVGVETNPLREGYTTFFGKSNDYKQEQLDKIERLLRDQSSYYGVAVHDYEGWKQLASR